MNVLRSSFVGLCAVTLCSVAVRGVPIDSFRVRDPYVVASPMDGPFVYRSPKSGKLFVFWSTTSIGGDHHEGSKVPLAQRKSGPYRVLVAESRSGRLAGPWGGHKTLFSGNGGHGMLFRTFDGQPVFTIHQPESMAERLERAAFFDVTDDGVSPLRLTPRL